MERNSSRNDLDLEDYNVNVRMVTFIVVIMVIVLTLIYFIRIYSNKKDRVIKEMRAEANLIDTVITEHLNYSKYFIYLMSNAIRENYDNLDFIKEELNINSRSSEFNMLFGWRKYSWINENYEEVVTNTAGIIDNPQRKEFIKNIVEEHKLDEQKWNEKITFYTSRSDAKSHSLKIIDSIVDTTTDKYLGSLVLSYDIRTMVDSLNLRKKNLSTNFVILDMNFDLVASSKKEIDNIIGADGQHRHCRRRRQVLR